MHECTSNWWERPVRPAGVIQQPHFEPSVNLDRRVERLARTPLRAVVLAERPLYLDFDPECRSRPLWSVEKARYLRRESGEAPVVRVDLRAGRMLGSDESKVLEVDAPDEVLEDRVEERVEACHETFEALGGGQGVVKRPVLDFSLEPIFVPEPSETLEVWQRVAEHLGQDLAPRVALVVPLHAGMSPSSDAGQVQVPESRVAGRHAPEKHKVLGAKDAGLQRVELVAVFGEDGSVDMTQAKDPKGRNVAQDPVTSQR